MYLLNKELSSSPRNPLPDLLYSSIITFTGNEIEDYNRLIALVGIEKAEQTIKEMIESYLKKE